MERELKSLRDENETMSMNYTKLDSRFQTELDKKEQAREQQDKV